ncbi:unnamed protein product, partial [Durusdinium trenchii]
IDIFSGKEERWWFHLLMMQHPLSQIQVQRRRGSEQNASTRLLLRLCRLRIGPRGMGFFLAPILASQLDYSEKTRCTKVARGLVHRGRCYEVIYDEFGGPKDMGQLLVKPFGACGPPKASLDHVNHMVVNKVIKNDIVVMMDFSDLVWPSVFFMPKLLARDPRTLAPTGAAGANPSICDCAARVFLDALAG